MYRFKEDQNSQQMMSQIKHDQKWTVTKKDYHFSRKAKTHLIWPMKLEASYQRDLKSWSKENSTKSAGNLEFSNLGITYWETMLFTYIKIGSKYIHRMSYLWEGYISVNIQCLKMKNRTNDHLAPTKTRKVKCKAKPISSHSWFHMIW